MTVRSHGHHPTPTHIPFISFQKVSTLRNLVGVVFSLLGIQIATASVYSVELTSTHHRDAADECQPSPAFHFAFDYLIYARWWVIDVDT